MTRKLIGNQPRCAKRHSFESGVSTAALEPRAGHWPPSELKREPIAPLRFQAPRLANSIFKGRSLAVALPGTRC